MRVISKSIFPERVSTCPIRKIGHGIFMETARRQYCAAAPTARAAVSKASMSLRREMKFRSSRSIDHWGRYQNSWRIYEIFCLYKYERPKEIGKGSSEKLQFYSVTNNWERQKFDLTIDLECVDNRGATAMNTQ